MVNDEQTKLSSVKQTSYLKYVLFNIITISFLFEICRLKRMRSQNMISWHGMRARWTKLIHRHWYFLYSTFFVWISPFEIIQWIIILLCVVVYYNNNHDLNEILKYTLYKLQALTYVKWQMSKVMISNAVVGRSPSSFCSIFVYISVIKSHIFLFILLSCIFLGLTCFQNFKSNNNTLYQTDASVI